MGSMHTGLEEYPDGAERLAAFYAERARHGVALIVSGGIAPDLTGVGMEGGAMLNDVSQIPIRRMSFSCFSYGCKYRNTYSFRDCLH